MSIHRDNTHLLDSQSTSSSETQPFKAPKARVEAASTVSVQPTDLPPRPDPRVMDRIYRKLDLRIIPALFVLHFLICYGGSAYGNALTMNFEVGHDLKTVTNCSTHQLSASNSLNTVAYILFDLPMNLIMSRVSPGTWIARIVISQGLVYTCYAAVKTAPGLIALRFFSGIVGAGIWPGMAYYISMYYPTERTATRIGYYFIAPQISGVIGGLTAAGFQKMDGMRGYYGWQWMMIIYGVVTTAVGLSIAWWLPGRPPALRRPSRLTFIKTTYPLNEEEQALHEQDMAARYATNTRWTVKDIGKVIIDPRLWPLVMMYFGVVGVGGGIGTFGSTILKANNPNLSGVDLSLLTAPIWLSCCLAILILTPLSDKFRNHRGFVFSCSCVITMVGMIAATFAHGSWSRYGGLIIAGFGLGAPIPIIMTWCSNVFFTHHGDIGTAAAAALVSGLGDLGSVATSYSLYTGWPADAERQYKDSNMVMVAFLGISIIAAASCTAVRWYMGDFGPTTLIGNTWLARFKKQ